MRKLVSILALIPAMLFAESTIWNGTVDLTWYTNNENATSYTITTAEELAGLALLVNGRTSYNVNMKDKTINLGNDILLNDTTGWQNWNENTTGLKQWIAIGTSEKTFNGTFDGKSHTVSGVYINKPDDDYQGLFGYSGGTIKNLGATASYIKGKRSVGNLVGYAGGCNISNSYATGNVSGTNYIGGLVGEAKNCKIDNSYATGNVSGTGGYAGGFVGSVDGTQTSYNIKNCYAMGNVNGGGLRVGGLVGLAQTNISNSYATGKVSGTTEFVGGLIGEHISSFGSMTSIDNSYYDSQTTNQTTSSGGTSKTTAEMKNIKTYLSGNWDFSSIWTFYPSLNDGYPILQHQLPSQEQFKITLADQRQTRDGEPTAIMLYTGSAIELNVTSVTFNGTTLTSGTDYDVVYNKNVDVGIAQAAIVGKGSYSGNVKVVTFQITKPRNIASSTIVVEYIPDQLWTGSPIEPKPVVYDFASSSSTMTTINKESIILKENTDYILVYTNNTDLGTAKITILGQGLYDYSQRDVTFAITKAETPIIRFPLATSPFQIKQISNDIVSVDLGYIPNSPIPLQIYDLKGNLIATEQLTARISNVKINVPNGIYLFKVNEKSLMKILSSY